VEASLAADAPASRAGSLARAAALLFVALVSTLAVYRQTPPGAAPEDFAATEFSSGRAMNHLAAVSQHPRPPGSPAHAAAREYLLGQLNAQGLEAQVQSASALNSTQGGALRAGTVHNVIGRLRGAGGGGGGALLIAGHYDTVPNSPGASDDGSSIAAMLETARALKAGPPLNNDVIFLFTDGEEVGLLGARAFVDEHPFAKDVRLALNFEARGNGGPAMMFETSSRNGRLIEEFAEAAPRPYANSVSYEIYRRLPNDTDLSVFKEARLPGLNFAFIEGVAYYHTRADSVANLDEGSLQHQGAYALALARHFGGSNLNDLEGGDAVYFDLLGTTLVNYPSGWAVVLGALALALSAAVTLLGFRRGRLTLGGVVAGCSAFILSMVCAPLLVTAVWLLIRTLQTSLGRSIQDDFYHSHLYVAGFTALTVAVATLIYAAFGKRANAESLAVGSLWCWLPLLAFACLKAPGASYLLTWPLLFPLAALALVFYAGWKDGGGDAKTLLVLTVCVVPGLILLVPMIYQTSVALGLNAVGVSVALAVLLLSLLVPQLSRVNASGRWALPASAALCGLALITIAALAPVIDGRHPQADSVFYALNADTGKAVWATADEATDEWTAQFLPEGAETGSLSEYIASTYDGFIKHQAPALPLEPAKVELLGDDTEDGLRRLRLKISSARPGVTIASRPGSDARVLSASVNGKRSASGDAGAPRQARGPWSLQYWAPPPEGIELTLEVEPSRPLELMVVEQSYGLPQEAAAAFKPRPEHTMPKPFGYSDVTLVTKSYTF
jgi:hypothetical protein